MYLIADVLATGFDDGAKFDFLVWACGIGVSASWVAKNIIQSWCAVKGKTTDYVSRTEFDDYRRAEAESRIEFREDIKSLNRAMTETTRDLGEIVGRLKSLHSNNNYDARR